MPDDAAFQLNRVDAIANRFAPTVAFALRLFHHLRQQFIRMNAVRMLIQITGKNQLVSLGLLHQHIQFGLDFLRGAHHRQAQKAHDGLFFMG